MYEIHEAEINNDIINKINSLVNNTSIFKTYFIEDNDSHKIYQAVRKLMNFRLELIHAEERDIEKIIDNLMRKDRLNSFNVFDPQEILIRIHMIKISETKSYLYNRIHHAITDGWSNILFLNKIYEILLNSVSNQEKRINFYSFLSLLFF